MTFFLKEYNDNTYLKLCYLLSEEISGIQSFISEIRENRDFPRLSELIERYENVFSKELISKYTTLKIERVINPHYSLFLSIPLNAGNSTFFISLKITNPELLQIDEIYNKSLSGLLRLYKNIFSVLDRPYYEIGEDILLKYERLIENINIKIKEISASSFDKQQIEKRKQLTRSKILNLPHKGFYHMTHLDNLESITSKGLFSHKEVYQNGFLRVDISNSKVQEERNRTESVFNKNIQEYVPLYINPVNPMMNSEKVKMYIDDIVLLEIIPHILVQKENTLFSDGNAAQKNTNFYHNQSDLEKVDWKLLQKGEWTSGSESHRMMCSEVLVPDKIEVYYIQSLILKSEMQLKKVLPLFPNHKGIQVEINSKYFTSTLLN